ncbi:Eco57I restriction-modification methylase domain-containing protein [Brevundimonas sp. TSRC1-1]|uniref:Eco57I restriction-modification methylase domain-containing protein n=1 Tax=Brevundimonas sp. TSRC1-1 TaxID=2804562 RepID=UPI003CFB7785
MSAPKQLLDLVARYAANRDDFRKTTFNETQARIELIDPLFTLLGWDMANSKGYSDEYREVIHEDRVRVEGKSKAPDYAFRIGGIRKFQLEAKKPSINIANDGAAAFQIRRYAWSAKLSLCVLTNFESLAIYDAAAKPAKTDTAKKARAKFYSYADYEAKWDEIYELLSPEGIQKGTFGKFAAGAGARRGSTTIDNQFLEEIESWRSALAIDIASNNRGLDIRALNQAVQALIDRIVFLRIAEDRGIEKYGRLRDAATKAHIYKRLIESFREADRRYNSGLFHLIKQHPEDAEVDEVAPALKISDRALKPIIDGLYYPDSPYEFSEMPADVLGQVYERFLGKVITLTAGVAEIEVKPEVKKAGGVFYTPSYVVRYLVNSTVGADLAVSQVTDISGKGKKASAPYRVVDPACGSGSFLIEVYQKLLDWYLAQYVSSEKTYSKGKDATIYKSEGGWRLRIAERKRILLDHVYGVDIDPQAVEVTKLSLLLKVLEGENSDAIAKQMDLFKDRVLPDLGNNIKCGNSLIGEEYNSLYPADMLNPEIRYTVNTFDWKSRFPSVFKSGGFDAVVGNPPYFSIDKTWGAGDHKTSALKAIYPDIHTDKTDIYYYFLAKGVDITQGSVGFIVSRAFLEAVKAEKVRRYLSTHSGVLEIFDFQNFPVFDGVGIATAMVVLSKRKRPKQTRVVKVSGSIAPTDRTEKFLAESDELARFDVARANLSSAPWRLSNTDIAAVFARIDKSGEPLSRLCKLGQGMQTGLNSVFGGKTRANIDAMGAKPTQVRLRVRNTDIQRFHILNREELMIYLEDVPTFASLPAGVKKYLESERRHLEERAAFIRGNCEWWRWTWPLQKELYGGPRIVCPYLAKENRFAIDEDFSFVGLTDTTVIFPASQKENLKYICGLLNSRLLNLRFKGIGKLKSNGIREYFDNAVSQMPIRRINWTKLEDVKIHDRIVELHDTLADAHQKLAQGPAAIVARDLRDQISNEEFELDSLVCELYGFSVRELADAEKAFA